MQKASQTSTIIVTAIVSAAVALAAACAVWCVGYYHSADNYYGNQSIKNFDDCAAAGYPIMESYPRQCRAGGKTFVEVIDNEQGSSGKIKDPRLADGCVTAGCSGTLCVSADQAGIITTCEYRAEYACYDNAKCEKQSSGKCGWTQTAALSLCLDNPPPLR